MGVMYRHDLAYLQAHDSYELLDSTLPKSVADSIHASIINQKPLVVCQQTLPNQLKLATSCLVNGKKYRVALRTNAVPKVITRPVSLELLLPALPPHYQPFLQDFIIECQKYYADVYVYGSFSHQYFSEQPFIHAKSDIDLLIVVNQSNYLAELLATLENLQNALAGTLKLDGEIRLGDKDISFNELKACLQQALPTILVKTLHSTQLEPTANVLAGSNLSKPIPNMKNS